MRVVTLNANGIRSAARRGFFAWAATLDADVICLQETRAQEHQLLPESAALPGYRAFFVDARKRGYSGVAIYTRHEPLAVRRTLGWDEIDAEGRFVQLDLGAVSVASLYVPSGISGAARLAFKMDFLERFLAIMAQLRHSGRPQIVCGDYNIAHKPIDIYNPARNAGVTGYLPEERAWVDTLVERVGWVDAFRVVNAEPRQYTWWSNFPAAWERNLGWRIDYEMVTPDLAPRVRHAEIYTAQRFSDHAPLIIDYELSLTSSEPAAEAGR
jgi:exodeoxyribonuclease-3